MPSEQQKTISNQYLQIFVIYLDIILNACIFGIRWDVCYWWQMNWRWVIRSFRYFIVSINWSTYCSYIVTSATTLRSCSRCCMFYFASCLTGVVMTASGWYSFHLWGKSWTRSSCVALSKYGMEAMTELRYSRGLTLWLRQVASNDWMTHMFSADSWLPQNI